MFRKQIAKQHDKRKIFVSNLDCSKGQFGEGIIGSEVEYSQASLSELYRCFGEPIPT